MADYTTSSNQHKPTYLSKIQLFIFTFYVFDRIACGLYSTIPSTTLLDLAYAYKVDLQKIGKIYSAKSIGSILGSIIGRFVKSYLRNAQKDVKHQEKGVGKRCGEKVP